MICDGNEINGSFSYPVGDVNGDGIDDFVSYFTGSSARLYLGNPYFSLSNNILLPGCTYGDYSGFGFGYGDVNHDSKSDFIASYVNSFNGAGVANLWIGHSPMHSGIDLTLEPPWQSDDMFFGMSLTMGDYNGDGYCDVAISAPYHSSTMSTPGIVYVYAGNSELATPNADDLATSIISELQMYPNPLLSHNSMLNVKFNKQIGNQTSTFEIYNIKGQKVKSFTISPEQSKSCSATYNLNDLSSGVYVCVITNGEMQYNGKITVIR